MRTYQLKQPATVQVLGNTETGDYLIVTTTVAANEFDVKVMTKADFEAAYVEVPQVEPQQPAQAETGPNSQAAV